MYQTWSYLLPAARTHPLLMEFFFLTPRDLLPCVHCRRHFRAYTDTDKDADMQTEKNNASTSGSAEHSLRTCIEAGRLPEFWYLVHNSVNARLKKPLPAFASSHGMRPFQREAQQRWRRHFWFWLETLAFNFPADITYPLPKTNDDRERELRTRLKTYILFFDMLKNLLPPNDEFTQRWVDAYFAEPPTVLTFTLRVHLLRWLLGMQRRCGYRTRRSFVQMVNELQPARSTV